MELKISTVRISGFRGIENAEVNLTENTILTGTNNSGKTSFLKALQISFGNRNFLSPDDFNIKDKISKDKIIIDVLIKPGDEDAFSEDWEILFTTDRIRLDLNANSFIPLRTIVAFDPIKNSYKTEQYILHDWPPFKSDTENWYEQTNGNITSFNFDEIPFFYVSAQRDITEDTKLKSSYLGKMLSKIKYSDEEIADIEIEIERLNKKAVDKSSILSGIKASLKGLDSAMNNQGKGVEITPFTKKIRDLNKGMSIYYSDSDESFSMEYHGMGTRSWSSILTLRAFINLLVENARAEKRVFFPIIAIEEPESHLHPNAQKKLYRQMDEINGQKIISTHSPYIAACAELHQIRSFYKATNLKVGNFGNLKLTPEGIRKIKRQVISSRGEIFFSKLIIFFEGETEEQALPILFEKFFGYSPIELGVDFVGVGGYEGYLPFLNFAKQFNIPSVVISDADNEEIIQKVRHQFNTVYGIDQDDSKLVFLDHGCDYEKQLLNDGFQEEIKKAILSLNVYANDIHKEKREPADIQETQRLNDDELYNKMSGSKTQMAPAVAEQMLASPKELPRAVKEVFEFVKATLSIEVEQK